MPLVSEQIPLKSEKILVNAVIRQVHEGALRPLGRRARGRQRRGRARGLHGGPPGGGGHGRRHEPKLKGAMGEGSNHSNFSHQSSFKILSKFRNFR